MRHFVLWARSNSTGQTWRSHRRCQTAVKNHLEFLRLAYISVNSKSAHPTGKLPSGISQSSTMLAVLYTVKYQTCFTERRIPRTFNSPFQTFFFFFTCSKTFFIRTSNFQAEAESGLDVFLGDLRLRALLKCS